ncbi:MAG: transketolase [Bacilli bacterium]|nr:transketolase [Bacilli bacterium]
MDREIINNIKSLAIDMISHAGSGHPGISLGAAPIMYTLYSRHMNISINDTNWISRDRFVLSAGHGSALLYATLFMAGLDLKINDLKNFRRANSKTPGHPEFKTTPGVDMSTGPLGQGLASAVGMALSQKMLKKRYYFPKKSVIEVETALLDYNVYVLCGDGDLMEGISYEAASFAGAYHLDNLIVLYDSNGVSLDGNTNGVFIDNMADRFKSIGWNYEFVKNGDNVSDIDRAIKKAKNSSKPTLIEIRTIIGNGLVGQGTSEVHGNVPKNDAIFNLKKTLGTSDKEVFYYSEAAKKEFTKMVSERGSQKYTLWSNNYRIYIDKFLGGESAPLNYLFNHNINLNLVDVDWRFEHDLKEATRMTNQKIMDEISKMLPNFVGGSADLANSTKTQLLSQSNVTFENYDGKNIAFGVREHAMGGIINGMSLCGFRPFCSTMLAFSDYLKPSIRMSALMGLPVVYIFSHDSIGIGPDGPTHQPVEQLNMLRAMPNLRVYRPADAHELIGSWNCILNDSKHPSALILSKQDVLLLPTTNPQLVNRGAYIIRKEKEKLDGIIIATGSDLFTAINLARDFFVNKKVDLRIVSMPEMSLFLEQPKDYQEDILPKGIKIFTIEASSSLGWDRFATSSDYIFSVNSFGISGTRDEVNKACGFDYTVIKQRMETLL